MIVGCRVCGNGSYGADSGLSRGDLCRRGIRPFASYKAAVGSVRFTSIRDVASDVSMRQQQSSAAGVVHPAHSDGP